MQQLRAESEREKRTFQAEMEAMDTKLKELEQNEEQTELKLGPLSSLNLDGVD